MADCIVAGGTESMSMVPTAGWKTVPAYSIASEEPDYYLSMGLTAEAVAKEYNVSRESQDEFSYHSHQKAIIADKCPSPFQTPEQHSNNKQPPATTDPKKTATTKTKQEQTTKSHKQI